MYDFICLPLVEFIITDKLNVIKVLLCLLDDGHFKGSVSCKLISKKHRIIAKVHTFQMNTP